MTPWQTKLYEDLTALVKDSECFYMVETTLNGVSYQVFNYRIAAYTEFCKPSALEARGHMFEMFEGAPKRLACLPMEKFFNLNENPFTMNWDVTKVVKATTKEDGSLISTFWQDAKNDLGVAALFFKSKTSLKSKQALDAQAWGMKHLNFYSALQAVTQFGYTVNMEWTAPDNRIVVGYQKPALTVLNVRNNVDGSYVSKDYLISKFPILEQHWVRSVDPQGGALIDKVKSMVGIEGYVVELADGRKAKVKTDWYVALHKTKESVDSDRKLFETIIKGAQDDLKSMFSDDPYVLGKIAAMEAYAIPKYKDVISRVETFYAKMRGSERKEYAIAAKEQLGNLMGLAMNRFLEREVGYEWHALKYPENFIEGFVYEGKKEE